MRKVKVNGKYRHFKGNIITVIAIAKHTETMEQLIVYEHGNQIWARPYEMFLSEVDHEKYPDVKQKYRFEEIE